MGKNGDIYPDETGRLLPAGARVSCNLHLHATRRAEAGEGRDRVQVLSEGLRARSIAFVPSWLAATRRRNSIFRPGQDNVRMDTYATLGAPAVLTQFEAHMHNRGKAMCLEAIYPSGSGKREGRWRQDGNLELCRSLQLRLASFLHLRRRRAAVTAGGNDSAHHLVAQQFHEQQEQLRLHQLDWLGQSHDRRHGAHVVELLHQSTRATSRLALRRARRRRHQQPAAVRRERCRARRRS